MVPPEVFSAPGDSHGFNPRGVMAFTKADVVLIVGLPVRFRLGYGRRLRSDAIVVQIDLDYRNVGKDRDTLHGLGRDWRRDSQSLTQALVVARPKATAKRARMDEEYAQREAQGYEKLLPSFKSESIPINPYRVAYDINDFLTENTVYIGDG